MGLSGLRVDHYQLRRPTESQATTDCQLPIGIFQYGGAPEPLSMIVSPASNHLLGSVGEPLSMISAPDIMGMAQF